MNNKVVIVAAKRTAIGNFCGILSTLTAAQLGAAVTKDLLNSTKIGPQEIDEIIMGQVLTAGCGQNPARQTLIGAGIGNHVPAFTVNKVCGSGLKSVALGYQSIVLGAANIVIAGGQESMSQAPHLINIRNPRKFGDATLIDSAIYDGLMDCFNDYHMGITAENVALQFGISRDNQDKFALESQRRAAAAVDKFAQEITPVEVKNKKDTISAIHDEFIKKNTTIEGLAALKPAFSEDGTVTAGNASGINDGASVVMLMSESVAHKRGLTPLAYIKSYASSGIDPSIMGLGPILAIKKAISLAKITLQDVDLIELNEAFASQSLAVIQELNLDPSITNVNGGAIALGHPIGASGTRCLTTLIHEMNRRQAKNGLVALCIGGGMGIAMCISKNA